jgi:hypothetical protein
MESTKTSSQSLIRLRRNLWWLRRCAALFGLSAALWPSPGWAQSSPAFLTTSDFFLVLQAQDGDSWADLSATDAATYLNQARCQCATPVRVLVQMASASRSKLSGLTTTGTNARLYVGNNCANLNAAGTEPQCPNGMLGWLSDISTLSENGSWVVDTTVDKLFAVVGDCSFTLSTTIWLWLDSTGRGSPDESVTGSSAPNLGIRLDGTAPEAPSGITVEGSDQALEVSWTPLSTTDAPDLAGYLVFCTRGDDLEVFNPSYYNNQYLTDQFLCSASASVAPTASAPSSAAGITTAIEIGAPSAFRNLDPSYLCSGLLPPTQTSLRLGTLQNGILYTVGVAAVDYSGNASPIQSGFIQTPSAAAENTGGLAKSGCDCQLAGNDRSAVPWGAMLALGVASRLRRRGGSQPR